MKFRYLREGILNKMGNITKAELAIGAAAGSGVVAHNALKNRKAVSEYDDYDCDEGSAQVYGTALKTVSKMNPATKRKLANVAVAGTGIGAGLAMDQAGAMSAMKKIKKSNESDYYDDFDEGVAGSAARAVGDTIRMASPKAKKIGATVAAVGATTGYCTAYGGKLSRKANGSNESDDYDCDEGVIGKTVKYGLAAGAALGAGKMARDAIKNRKTVSEYDDYDDYDCDEGVGTALVKVGGKSSVLKRAGDAIRSGASKLKSKAGAMKNSLKTDYVSKGSALKVAAGTAAAGAAAGAVAGSKLAGKKNESLAAAMNGGRIPRRAKSVSVQESYRRIRESKNDFVEYYAEQIEKVVNIRNLEKFIEREWNDWKEKSTSRKKNFYAWVAFSFKRAFDKSLQDQGIDDWDFWQKGDGKFYNTGDKLHTLTRNLLQYWEKKYNLYLHTDEPNVRGA